MNPRMAFKKGQKPPKSCKAPPKGTNLTPRQVKMLDYYYGASNFCKTDALRRTGWHNYTLFCRPDGTLFGYVEVEESFQASLDGMAKEEVNQRWQDEMSRFFQLPEGAHPDQNMIEWREVFHLD